jgi:hypothetical protein
VGCVVKGFRRGANEISALLGCYTVLIDSYLPTFRDSLSTSSSTYSSQRLLVCLILEDGKIGLSATNHHQRCITPQKSDDLIVSDVCIYRRHKLNCGVLEVIHVGVVLLLCVFF